MVLVSNGVLHQRLLVRALVIVQDAFPRDENG